MNVRFPPIADIGMLVNIGHMRKFGPLAILFLLGSCGGDFNVVENHYATLADVKGFSQWIPRWVPPSARNIHDIHNMDDGEQNLTFVVPASDIQPLVAPLSRLKGVDERTAARLASRLGWTRGRPKKELEAYYVCDGQRGVMFVDRQDGRVLFRSDGQITWTSSPCGPA